MLPQLNLHPHFTSSLHDFAASLIVIHTGDSWLFSIFHLHSSGLNRSFHLSNKRHQIILKNVKYNRIIQCLMAQLTFQHTYADTQIHSTIKFWLFSLKNTSSIQVKVKMNHVEYVNKRNKI